MALADHVVVMNHGRIEDEGTPERVYGKPATRFSATFMGESTIVTGIVTGDGCVSTPLGAFSAPVGREQGNATGEITLAIRPEHVQLGPGLAATVVDIVYQGSFKRVTARLDSAPDMRLLARLPADADLREGSAVSLRIDPAKIVILKG